MTVRVNLRVNAITPKPRRLLSALAVISLLYAFLCTFPGIYAPLAPGIDESWMFALNRLAEFNPYLFGRDTVFTYGPLGFLLAPREVGSGISLIISEVFWCLLQIFLFVSVAWQLRGRWTTLLLFSSAYLISCALGFWVEYQFIFAVCAIALLSLEQSRQAWFFAAMAAMLAVAGLQMKWSVGLAAISVVAGSWLLLVKEGTHSSRKTLLAALIAATCSLLVFVQILFRSPANFWKWVFSSIQMIRGYSSAMSLEGPYVPLLLAAIVTATLICLHFLLTKWPRRCFWLFIPFFFFAFKEGFVRQDGHRMAFFFAAAAIPVLLLLSPVLSERDRKLLTCAFLVLSAITVLHASIFDSYPELRWRDVRSFVLMQSGLQNVKRLIWIEQTRQKLRAAARITLQPSVVPESWQKRFDASRSTVSILPLELSMAAANRMNWQPTASIQLYNASTRALDEEMAMALAEHGAEYLIVTYEAIDGRNLILDTPATWRVVMEYYNILETDPNGRRALLVRRPRKPETMHKILGGSASLNEWVPVRETNHLLYASLDISYTPIGKLADALYHVPALYIETIRQSGRAARYRLIPRTASSGVLINYLPDNQYDMEELFKGKGDDPVARFRLVPSVSSSYFQHQYAWNLIESTSSLALSGETSEPPAIPSIMPTSGSGRQATIEITASDPNGAQDIRLIQVLVNHELNGVKACYLSYEVAEERLWLIADVGSGPAGFGRPGELITLANSQCKVLLGQASVRMVGTAVMIRISLEFTASFTGTQHFYAYAIDRKGLRMEWNVRATWLVN